MLRNKVSPSASHQRRGRPTVPRLGCRNRSCPKRKLVTSAHKRTALWQRTPISEADTRQIRSSAVEDFTVYRSVVYAPRSRPTKVVTGENTRWIYLALDRPKSVHGGPPKYTACLLVPKSDTQTVAAICAAIEAAYIKDKSKLKGNRESVPPLEEIKIPLKDGDADHPDNPDFANCFYINARNSRRPEIVDVDLRPITDSSKVYDGVFGRASITFYGYNKSGACGIGCGLQNLQKFSDGEPPKGKSSAATDFAPASAE